MGVNVFLAPILDILNGPNPWLQGRTFSSDPNIVGSHSAAFVRGVQRGGVAATAKHFPGLPTLILDPAIDERAVLETPYEYLADCLQTFRQVIAANVELVMVGPAVVNSIDTEKAALRSDSIVDKLKHELNFQGVILADDLDSKATLRGDQIEQVAIDALNAGCNLLLLADHGDQLARVIDAIVNAVNDGKLDASTLMRSAEKVGLLAKKYAIKTHADSA